MLKINSQQWRNALNKRIVVYGMSGLGKTHLSKMLRGGGSWFHYSVDYRIGTRYMGDYIVDNAIEHAIKVPFLRDLLMSDSIYIGSNITFDNLNPVSTYLGKPGDPSKGGLPIDEFHRRQEQFRKAEIQALLDTEAFIRRSERLYNYPNFICDTGGSFCEWVDGDDPEDPILNALSTHCLLVGIKGDESHTRELVKRFNMAPKPMCYQHEFVAKCWSEYLDETGVLEDKVNPDDFIRWTYARALSHREPRHLSMAKWGITVYADDIASLENEEEFIELVAGTLVDHN
ncbi:MAG: ATPase [Roseovarius sp.]|nr:ATPase [Roseovarius sp.]MCY4209129.1 ATPase [Roseovarius sp.]MCY4290749.1 ATPase [Roseovarius sp.]MCY4315762.1 ATPase [Roseovarius sp.]